MKTVLYSSIHSPKIFFMPAGNTSREETIAMVKYFREHHMVKMEGRRPTAAGPTEIAYNAWFKLQPLMDFLIKIQAEPHRADGVRVYFGAHYTPADDDYYGYNNVIFVGTKGNGTANVDLPADKFTDNTYAFSTIPVVQKISDEDLNNGHLCPPGCDGGETI